MEGMRGRRVVSLGHGSVVLVCASLRFEVHASLERVRFRSFMGFALMGFAHEDWGWIFDTDFEMTWICVFFGGLALLLVC